MFEVTGIVVILTITTVINFLATYISWRRRKNRYGLFFALGMTGVTLWTLASAFDYAAVPIPLKVFFATIEAWGYKTAIPFFFLFALSFAGYGHWLENNWVKVLFILVPASNILLVSTNGLHGLFWTGFIQSSDNIVIFKHGPAFFWVQFNEYLMIFGIVATLWMAIRKGANITRQQGYLLLGATLFPLATNVVYNFLDVGMEGVDWTSITFSITGILFLRALYGTRLLDLVPIARDKLVSSLRDGMIALDMQNRIIDINQAAADTTQLPIEKLIGKTLAEVAPLSHSFLEQPPEQEFKTELEVDLSGKRYFDLLISPLRDGRKKLIGRLIIFRDITGRKQIENALRISEERFRELVMSAPDAVFGINADGSIIFANHEASNLLGYENDELLGREVDMLVPSGMRDRHAGLRMGYFETPYTRMMGSGLDLTARRKDGVEVPVEISLSHSITETGPLVIAFMRDITERKLAEEKFSQVREQLMEQQRELAKLEERQRLARDLHDSVTQSINGMVLFTDTLAATLEKNNIERARQIMDRLRESAKQSLKETRLMLYELQESGPERTVDLIQDLEDRLAMVERRVGLRAQLIQEGSMQYCPPEWQENLFWIAVEALNNSLKHAQAHSVQIVIRCTPQQLDLEVSDNGKGFETHKLGTGGLGLKNMRARADIIGGMLSIESEPLKGTTVRFCAEIRTA